MSIHTIYRIVNNINGKVYIGYDSKWPNRKGKVPSYEALKQRSESIKRTLQLKRELSQS